MTLPQLAWAGLSEGLAAYTRSDYATALKEMRPLAEQGDAQAQLLLVTMYDRGQGVGLITHGGVSS